MNKIFNWTIGSFFRSIGRMFAYLLVGLLIGYLLKNANIDFTNLLFMSVNASSVTSTNNKYNLYVDTNVANGCSAQSFTTDYVNLDTVQDLRSLNTSVSVVSAISVIDYLSEVSLTPGNNYSFSVIQSYNPKEYSSWNPQNWQYSLEGSTSTSTSGLSSNNIASFGCSIENISSNNYQVKITCSLSVRNAIQLLFFRVRTLCNTTSINYFNTYNLQYELLDSTSNAINNQTNIINNGFNSITNDINNSTSSIINNQNENTQQQIESQKVCKDIIIDKTSSFSFNGYLDGNGNLVSDPNNTSGVTDYIKVNSDSSIILTKTYPYYLASCFYNSSKGLISCINPSSYSLNANIPIPVNSKYVRFSINKNSNNPNYLLRTCINGNQALNDTLSDDDTTSSTEQLGSFFEDFTTDTHGLTGVITAPLNAINSLTSATCSPLVLPLPYIDEDLTLPCMRTLYEEHFGGFMTLYDVITLGIISYWVMIRIFNLVKDFKNPEHDEIEVMDL